MQKHMRNIKTSPYGSKKKWTFCGVCDMAIEPIVSKKSERQKAKREIKKELKDE